MNSNLERTATRRRTLCPHCGAPIEATVGRYLSGVQLDEENRIVAFDVWSGNDADGYAWDLLGTRVYCSEDCEIEWEPPLGVMDVFFDGVALELTELEAASFSALLTEVADGATAGDRLMAKRILVRLDSARRT
jgi:hypothetical protein